MTSHNQTIVICLGKCRGRFRGGLQLIVFFLLVPFSLHAQWPDGYQYRKAITLDGTQISGNLTDFPVLISLTDADLQSKVSSDGDVVFTDSDGTTLLNHDLEQWDPTIGELIAWVELTLSSGADKTIYLYYGQTSGSASSPTPSDTWSTNFKGVYHLHDDVLDATANNNDATLSGSADAVGQVADGQEFDGVNDYIDVSPDASISNLFAGGGTVSAWINPDTYGENNFGRIADKNYWTFYLAGGTTSINWYRDFTTQDGFWQASYTSSGWHHVVVTYDEDLASNTPTIYINGTPATVTVSQAAIGSAVSDASSGMTIGNEPASTTRTFDGVIDEIRIYDGILDANWIQTEYNNQLDPSGFIKTLGSEEECATPGTASAVNSSIPFNTSTTITLSDYSVSASIQWQSSTDNVNFSDIGGAMSETYNTANITSRIYYRAEVTGASCTVYSNTVAVTAFNSDYCQRKRLTVDADQVSGSTDLIDFPMLVKLSDPDLRSVSNGGMVESDFGYDIVFADEDGVSFLNHQVEKYEPTTGVFIAWVKVPTLKAGENSDIYLYFGKSGATDPSTSSTWSATHGGVWHLHDDFLDATGNGRDGTNTGSDDASGRIADGQSFSETNQDTLNLPDFTYGNDVSLSFWFNIVDNAGSFFQYVYSHGTVSTNNSLNVYFVENSNVSGPGQLRTIFMDNDDAAVSLDAGTFEDGDWHHYYLTVESGIGAQVYVDGSLRASSGSLGGTTFNPSGDIFVGCRNDGDADRTFGGLLDEIKIQGSARSSDWVATEYNNQNSPSTFYAVSDTEYPYNGGIATAEDAQLDYDMFTVISLDDNEAGTIQWEVSTDNITFTDEVGATSESYTTQNLQQTTYFRARVDNGSCTVYSTTVQIDVNPPYSNGFSRRKKISIDPTNVEGGQDFTSYPLLINVTDTDLRTVANGGRVTSGSGYDIQFTTSDGVTALSHQLETYDATTGQLVAWVSLPTLYATVETVLYIYYGNCTVTTDQSSTAVWGADYKAIWHLGGTYSDATSNGNNAVNHGSTVTAGAIGDGQSFDQVNDYISALDFDYGDEISLSLWFNVSDLSGSLFQYMYSHGFRGSTNSLNAYFPETSNTASGNPGQLRTNFLDTDDVVDLTDVGLFNDGQWHQYFLTVTVGEGVKIYVDGDIKTTLGASGGDAFNPPDSIFIGARDDLDPDRFFNGLLDEIRVKSASTTADYIKTEYNNQSDPSSFMTFGSEEVLLQWTGNTSSDWNTTSNWGDCQVPASGTDVRILSGASFWPVLTSDAAVGDLYLDASAQLSLGIYDMEVQGNLQNDGAVTASSGSFSFTGTEDQFIYGDNAIAFNDVTVNKSTGLLVPMSDTNISGTLTLTSGMVALSDANLTIGSSGQIAGGGETSYIITSNTYTLTQQGLGGSRTGDILFPVGPTGASYSPATVNNTGTADDFSVRMLENAYQEGTSGTLLTSDVVDLTWVIDEAVAGGSNAALTLQWSSSDELTNFDRSVSYVSHYNSGGNWEVMAYADVATDEGGGYYSRSASGINDFSPFGVGSGGSPLPVELLYFDGQWQDGDVLLSWETTYEIDNDFFTVERSFDGEDFQKIGQIPGQGHSSSPVQYSFVDTRPSGHNYYRLKQTDFDGSHSHSNVIVVTNDHVPSLQLSIYPNTNNGVDFQWAIRGLVPNSRATMAIFDIEGKMLRSQELSINSSGNFATRGIPNLSLLPGIYLLKIINEGEEVVSKIVVR